MYGDDLANADIERKKRVKLAGIREAQDARNVAGEKRGERYNRSAKTLASLQMIKNTEHNILDKIHTSFVNPWFEDTDNFDAICSERRRAVYRIGGFLLL